MRRYLKCEKKNILKIVWLPFPIDINIKPTKVRKGGGRVEFIYNVYTYRVLLKEDFDRV